MDSRLAFWRQAESGFYQGAFGAAAHEGRVGFAVKNGKLVMSEIDAAAASEV